MHIGIVPLPVESHHGHGEGKLLRILPDPNMLEKLYILIYYWCMKIQNGSLTKKLVYGDL
jgi:hypothetical protein